MTPVAIERKRPSGSLEVQLVGQRMSKRRDGSKTLFTNDYEEICLGMSDLTHEKCSEDPLRDFDVFLDAFIELNVKEKPACTRSIEDLLDLEWYSTLSVLDQANSQVRRAINLCTSCGIKRFRDVLWYNRTLRRAASLRRLPICLVDTAYQLKNWYPRSNKPMATIETWRNAWFALAQIWSALCLALPRELKQVLLVRKYDPPPETANWFEFNYFDEVYSRMEPLLCYHDEELDRTEPVQGNAKSVVSITTKDLTISKDDDLSDDDPRRASIRSSDSESEGE